MMHPANFARRLRTRYREVALMNPRLRGPAAYANWIRSNLERIAGTERVGARPLKLTFDPTNVCQLRCPLCPTGMEAQDRAHGHARLEMFERLLDEVGHYLFLIDFYNWGEPLLNTHVENFIRAAAKRRIVCTMSSNLSLPLSGDRIDRIVASGLSELIVAMDGASRESYATYRRRGDFDLVCENVRQIVNAKRRLGQSQPLITWQYLVFRFNEDEIAKARKVAAELGVDRLELRAPFIDIDRYQIPEPERTVMAQWAAQEPLYQIEPAVKAAAVRRHARCGWHYTSAAINWDGSVAPCCTVFSTRDDFGTLGKSGERSYMEVINNDAFRLVRRRFAGRESKPVDLVCERCPTPLIMDYHKALNRQIALISVVAAVERVRRVFRASPRLAPAVDAAAALDSKT